MSEWRQVEDPKIWASRFPRFLDIVSFEWSNDANQVEFVHAFRDRLQKVGEEIAPKSLVFDRHSKIPAATTDAFKIIGGVRVVSPALRDVFVQFDMTGVQLFEVPIFADKDGTPSGLPNHFVLNVYGAKDALIPELSENIQKRVLTILRRTEPLPNAKWSPKKSLDVVALSASACDGPDLWRDPNYDDTLFFSDRLKRAIDAAGLKTKALSFAPTKVYAAS